MSFESDIDGFLEDEERRENDIFVASTVEVRRSIVEGSELTGAPGQPVDTGALLASFTDRFESRELWSISTNIGYAEVIENGVGFTQRSPVGGSHSLKLTESGWDRIIEHVTRTVR